MQTKKTINEAILEKLNNYDPTYDGFTFNLSKSDFDIKKQAIEKGILSFTLS
jgi:hypothetical protein